ncbi:MAG: patatin-like phospholipase family protein [Candidatus Nitrosopolaris sp.]
MAGKEKETTSPETVLILQGGGSLGAYECGVWKTLARHNIKFEIIAGTSIGAANAAIIAAHKGSNNSEVDNEDSAKMLENFWLELAENIMPPLPLPQQFSSTYSTDGMRAVFASMYSAIYGNPKAFFPQWIVSSFFNYYFQPFKPLAYPLFDITPLKKTLSRYVDFDIFKTSKKRPRLIVTCTNIQTSNPVIYDSKNVDINAENVVASAGFPFYGISWTQQNNKYLWDGALLSNTPLREIVFASPTLDKIIYLVNIFPRYQKELPQDIFEAWHRARDIIYCDKTDSSIHLSKIISRYLMLLKEMHELLTTMMTTKLNNNTCIAENHDQREQQPKTRLDKLEIEYNKLVSFRGAVIRKIIRIERQEKTPFLFEDADFSVTTIKNLIRQGEEDMEKALIENR